ncbi:MAG TPA: diacylglycerol kinase family protein [Roseomonas sp.]|jgi:diacylglycerol kinase family enzyme
MRVTVLHHPDAGEGEWPEARLKAFLAAAGIHGRYCPALGDAAAAALREAAGVVIAAGGDATVARAAMLLDRAQAALAIMPTGGANNIARSLGAWRPPERIAAVVASRRSVALPIGQVQAGDRTRCFVEAAGIGALTRSMRGIERGLPRDRKRQVGRAALRQALLAGEACRAAVVLDGAALTEPFLTMELMNIEQIGPALRLADPRQADGRMAAVWLPVAARDAMLDWLDQPDGQPAPVREARVRHAAIHLNGEPLRLDAAAEPAIPGPIALSLQDQPVRVLIPEIDHDHAADT